MTRRRLPAAVLRSFGEAAVATGALLTAGCGNGRLTRAECTDMLDRYVDMTVAGDTEHGELTPTEARAARETKKSLLKGEPSYKRVEEQCEAEVTRHEYRCAMKAPTPETWQACID